MRTTIIAILLLFFQVAANADHLTIKNETHKNETHDTDEHVDVTVKIFGRPLGHKKLIEVCKPAEDEPPKVIEPGSSTSCDVFGDIELVRFQAKNRVYWADSGGKEFIKDEGEAEEFFLVKIAEFFSKALSKFEKLEIRLTRYDTDKGELVIKVGNSDIPIPLKGKVI